MVENNLGLAILPKLALIAGHFDIVDTPIEPKISRPIGIIYKSKDLISASSRIFINYLIEHTKNYPDVYTQKDRWQHQRSSVFIEASV